MSLDRNPDTALPTPNKTHALPRCREIVLRGAAAASLEAMGLAISETAANPGQSADTPYATLDAREACGCGLPQDHYELTLTTHIWGLGQKPRELIRVGYKAERALLALGPRLGEWQILDIYAKRSQIRRQAEGTRTGCLSFQVLLLRNDTGN